MDMKRIGYKNPHTMVLVSGRLQGERITKNIQARAITIATVEGNILGQAVHHSNEIGHFLHFYHAPLAE